jgi:hypothetical protein
MVIVLLVYTLEGLEPFVNIGVLLKPTFSGALSSLFLPFSDALYAAYLLESNSPQSQGVVRQSLAGPFDIA